MQGNSETNAHQVVPLANVYIKGYCFLSSFAPVLSRFFSDFSLSCLDSFNKTQTAKQMRRHERAFKEVQAPLQMNTNLIHVPKWSIQHLPHFDVD